jgi:glycosyltransferase involved in cell wall biosynthesis
MFPRVQMHHLPPNRSERIKEFIQNDADRDLKVVVFDRFFAEEAYSFHFYNERPDVLRVLDMQDMHSLRYHRQNMVQTMDANIDMNGNGVVGLDCFQDTQLLNTFPMVQDGKHGTISGKDPSLTLLRELAAIHRSDLTLVCSPFEMALLTDEYGINPGKLVLAPFFTEAIESYHQTEMDERRDFVVIGGFKHPPNIDQVMLLKRDIWPKIRASLPDAKLHIYGAYPPPRIQQLHDERNGFLVHGHVKDLDVPLGQARVLLAPLRYGAGIKGKIVDAWRYGCPVVTTPIGSEGIEIPTSKHSNTREWGGIISSDNDSFVKSAVQLYSDKTRWSQSQSRARVMLKELFDAEKNLHIVNDSIVTALKEIDSRRQRDYSAAMLWHNSARSTEYFSRWIELKEGLSNDSK